MVVSHIFRSILTAFVVVSCGSSGSTPPGGGSGGSSSGSGGRAGSSSGGGGHSHSGNAGAPEPGGEGGEGAQTDGGAAGSPAGEGGNGGDRAGSAGTGGTGATAGGDAGAAGDAGEGGEGAAPAREVQLTVNTGADIHSISPLIYGMNPGRVPCDQAGVRFGLCRLGGSRWSTYNWENNASNSGIDACFQNDGALAANDTPGSAVSDTLAVADAVGASTVVTLPLLDYVAADKLGGDPNVECSGDVRETPDYLTARFDANRSHKGAPLSVTPDTADGFVNQDEFVAFLRDTAGSAPVMFSLDSQPGIWNLVHEPVHPVRPTYDEVVERNVEYATMVRDIWPSTPIFGYGGYGWFDFVSLQESPEFETKGDFIDYYLSGLKTASEADGRRLIDYLDVHWYSEVYADGQRIVTDALSQALTRARVQAPRSLWDLSYVEDSWITEGYLLGAPIALIPRLREKIDANYPGTNLSIGEWTYGGGSHVSGAIATADALGIFGREGVAAAAWVSTSANEAFSLGAFRIFRNYDGSGAEFGDRSVRANSSDDSLASVYASVASTNAAHLVIVAINKSASPLPATINVTHASALASAKVYRIDQDSPVPEAAPDVAANGNVFAYTMPAYSVSVLVPQP